MFTPLLRPEKPPTTAEEALVAARLLLQTAELTGAIVSLEKPADVPSGLQGAELNITLPIPALEAALHKAAVKAAAEQGVKISQTNLRLSEPTPNRLHLHVTVEAKVFGGSLKIDVEGDVTPEGETHVRFSGFKMESGGGMFGGIATAMIRPKLSALEAAPLELQQLTGVPVRLTQLGCLEETLTLRGAFSAPPTAAAQRAGEISAETRDTGAPRPL